MNQTDAIQDFLQAKQMRLDELDVLISNAKAQLEQNPVYIKLQEYQEEQAQVAAAMKEESLKMLIEQNRKSSEGSWGKVTRFTTSRLKITNEAAIPDKYFQTIRSVNEKEVKTALELGNKVQGAELSTTTQIRLTRRISESS